MDLFSAYATIELSFYLLILFFTTRKVFPYHEKHLLTIKLIASIAFCQVAAEYYFLASAPNYKDLATYIIVLATYIIALATCILALASCILALATYILALATCILALATCTFALATCILALAT